MAALTLFVGIDPGKQGGIAVIDQFGARLQSREMPVTAGGAIDACKLRDLLVFTKDEGLEVFVGIEKSQAMPGQGVVAVFSYGVGFGRLQAVVELLGIPHIYVRPQQWKHEFGLLIPRQPPIVGETKKEKGVRVTAKKRGAKRSSVALATELFPHFDDRTPRGRLKDGEAEALLIAEYCRRHHEDVLK